MSKLTAQTEKLSEEVKLPNSEKIYIDGKQEGVRVPFREIRQNLTRNFDGTLEENPPIRVYDNSGPWDDPSIHCDVRAGLPPLRRDWIIGRGDVEEYLARACEPSQQLSLNGPKPAQQNHSRTRPGFERLDQG